MNVLVTGGTGFIGSHLIRRLMQKGYHIKALVRKTSNLKRLEGLKIEFVHGNITVPESLIGVCKGVDVVCHIAGILGQWGVSDEVYWDVNVKGTENILNQCLLAKVKRVVYCSTAGVVGPIDGTPADESYPYNPSNIYEQTKSEAEKLVLRFCQQNNISCVVIRPEFIYGPGDTHVLGLFKAVKKGIFPIIGGGRTTLHPTYIDDLIQGFERCIEKKDTTGDNVYFIAGEEIVSVATLANAIAKALNVSPPKIYLPIWLTRLGASILEPIGRRFRFEPPLTKAKINFFTQSRGVNISKAKRELGYEPTVGLEQGLVKTVEWYRKYGYL